MTPESTAQLGQDLAALGAILDKTILRMRQMAEVAGQAQTMADVAYMVGNLMDPAMTQDMLFVALHRLAFG